MFLSTEHHSDKPTPPNKIENHPGFNENVRNPTWASEDTLVHYDTVTVHVAPHRRTRAGFSSSSAPSMRPVV